MLCVNHPTPSHYCTQHSEYSRTPKMAFLGVMIAPLTYKDIYIFSSFQNETSNLPVNLERKKKASAPSDHSAYLWIQGVGILLFILYQIRESS
jgi:hypothetical protein